MSSPRDTDPHLETLALGITDVDTIDWDAEAKNSSGHHRTMQLIEDVFHAHRMLEDPPDPDEPCLFRWGGLEVREKIAEGGFGEVYRAFDPRLQRSVALKLRKHDSSASTRAWIDEARSLAQLRHPNILTVYDAATHDDRAGIVTELLEGRTLEKELAQDGPLDDGSLAEITRSLSRALSAVHRSGLVHGDVKPSNVLREADGRIVLMDFGSTSRGIATGTPLYTAPEFLAGGASTAASDVYALAVLLCRMASGNYPFPASSLDELKDRQRRSPELPEGLRSDLMGCIRQALSMDPARRPSLVEFVAAAAPTIRPASQHRLWARALLIGVPVVALMLILGVFLSRPGLIEVQQSSMLRVVDGQDIALAPQTQLQPGDHLAYNFGSDEQLHLYIFNEDAQGESFLLFPAPHLDQSNPLPGGTVNRLPGSSGGESFDWVVSSAGGTESFLVVASREPLPMLESELERLRSASPERTPIYAELTPELYEGLRGVGGSAPTSDTGTASGRLAELARSLRGVDDDIWVEMFTVGAP